MGGRRRELSRNNGTKSCGVLCHSWSSRNNRYGTVSKNTQLCLKAETAEGHAKAGVGGAPIGAACAAPIFLVQENHPEKLKQLEGIKPKPGNEKGLISNV